MGQGGFEGGQGEGDGGQRGNRELLGSNDTAYRIDNPSKPLLSAFVISAACSQVTVIARSPTNQAFARQWQTLGDVVGEGRRSG